MIFKGFGISQIFFAENPFIDWFLQTIYGLETGKQQFPLRGIQCLWNISFIQTLEKGLVIAAYPLTLYQSKLSVHLFFQCIDTLELRCFSQTLVYSLHLFQAVPYLFCLGSVLIPFDLHQPFHFQFHKLVHKVLFSCFFKILFPEYDGAVSAHALLPVHSAVLAFSDNTFQRCVHKRLPIPFS